MIHGPLFFGGIGDSPVLSAVAPGTYTTSSVVALLIFPVARSQLFSFPKI
jgi:hypothetical protein